MMYPSPAAAHAAARRLAARYPGALTAATPSRRPGLAPMYDVVVGLRPGALLPSGLGGVLIVEADQPAPLKIESNPQPVASRPHTYAPLTTDWSSMPKTRIEAKAVGATHFFSGEPCKFGHVMPRRTVNGLCVQCGRDRARAYCAR